MSLAKYNEKRRFDDTPEPEGKEEADKGKLTFVVQRHHASHLHYDFRLELNGTLKSWAVPKGPSLDPHDKRLAMMVEDHPISYANFEGDIPEGNYGAGHVDVWDHGTYQPIDEDAKVITAKEFAHNLHTGNAKFRMKGRHLKGDFALVNMKKDEKTWLLLKHKDKYATEPYNAEDYAKKSSLAYTAERNKGKTSKKKVKPIQLLPTEPEAEPDPKTYSQTYHGSSNPKFTEYIKPMLAKLHDKPFDDPNWVYEIKWDGYRAIAEIDKKDILLYSRNGLSFAPDYPAVFEELKKIKKKVVIDGEIVALDDEGVGRFQLLQNYARDKSVPLVYYVFDCLSVNGKSIEDKTLLERKEILKSLLPESDIIKYCDHIAERGKDFFKVMQAQGLEGMIAKRADSHYVEGGRTTDWLKVKNIIMEEAVIAGYTEARGGRKHFGALVLGLYKNGKLTYIGHTGTGFNNKTLKELHDKLQPLVTDESPFDSKVPVNSPVTWVKPVLVCNLKYSEITEGGHRRHPVFMGLRVDKAAEDVHEEVRDNEPAEAMEEDVTAGKHEKPATKQPAKTKRMDKTRTIGGKELSLTHLDKVYWPDEGYTKGDVVAYYDKIYKVIGKYLKDRPESLMRTPNGIKGGGFFHKDAGLEGPEWLKSIPLYSESAEKEINYIICNDKPTLLYLANLGCIEINPWNSRTGNLDNPDYFVMDLDPSDNNTFEQVIETAQAVKEVLDRAGAISFPKTSGSSGIHIYVPLGAQYDYEQAKNFAHLIAKLTHDLVPDFTTLERSLKTRGKDHLYIDYLQNRKGQTLACAYSLRPKPGATVSTPLEWKEVKKGLHPSQFNINNIFERIEKKGDLFGGVLKKGIDMRKCLENLGG